MKLMSLCARAGLAALLAAAALVAPGQAAKWNPVDPAELALAAPRVEQDADAEALLWDVTVHDIERDDEVETVYEHYVRIKLFTDRGREAQSRVDIPHGKDVRVYDVEGRTVKRDGSTVELKGGDVFARDLVNAGGLKVKATSFVLPGAETGGLIEYRWRETHQDSLAHNLRLPFSRSIPVHLVKYHIRPLPTVGSQFTMRVYPFHCQPTKLVQEGPGKFFTSLTNVPALRDEPRAPSEWELRPWLFVYYDYRASEGSPQAFWGDWSKEVAKATRKATAPGGAVKRAAAELKPADSSVGATVAAILDLLRSRVTRMDMDTTSEAEREGFKGNKDLDDALAKGRGGAWDVRLLFVALARARNLDARLVYAPSRDDMRIDPAWMLPQLFEEYVVAVRDGAEWRFVDPTNAYSRTGALRWTQEGQQVLVPDDKDMVVVNTPLSPPDTSGRRRTATFTLLEDGTLEGDVTGEMTGHVGLTTKELEDGLSAAEREKDLREALQNRLPGAEVTGVRIDHVTAPDKPYTYTYHLRVPGYAQRAGSRLILQPVVLQIGQAPEFSAEQRKYPIHFRYAWQEVDEITITLPPGYRAEPAVLPAELKAGPVAGHTLTVSADGSAVKVRRLLSFGAGGRLTFEANMYSAIKRFFDDVARRDAVSITVRKTDGGNRP